MDDQRQEGTNRPGDPDDVENTDALRLKPPSADGTFRLWPRLGVSMDRRLRVLAALVLVVGVGLAFGNYDGLFPRMLGRYPGDALWTVAAYLGWKLVLPSMGPRGLGVMALGLSFLASSACSCTTRLGWMRSEATASGTCCWVRPSTRWTCWPTRLGVLPQCCWILGWQGVLGFVRHLPTGFSGTTRGRLKSWPRGFRATNFAVGRV